VDLKKYDGTIQVESTVKDGKDPAAVEQGIYEELEKLKDEPLPAEELQKIKNQAKANAYRRLSSPFSIAIQLMIYDGFGDWRYINTYAEEVDRVTAADIQRTAKEYFTKENRTVGVFLRKGGDSAADDDPEIAALPAPAQGMARQQIARIKAETDPAKLREGLAQMEEGEEPGSPGDEARARTDRQTGAGAPGRPGRTEEVKTTRLALTLAVLAAAAAPLAAQAPAIPDNPEKLVFAPIAYAPPAAKDYRVVLKNGMVVFIAEDPTLPLVNIELTLRTGSYLVRRARRAWPASPGRRSAGAARRR
jgi:hypothetical protein